MRRLAAVVALALSLGGCTATLDAAPSCEPSTPGASAAPGAIVMVDMFDTTARGVRELQEGVKPFLQKAVQDKAVVEFVLDPGAGADLVYSNCLGRGTPVGSSSEDNLLDDLADTVRDHDAVSVGSPRRLLASIPQQVGELRGRMQSPEATVDVVLWSTLLANDASSDCLQVHRLEATSKAATAVVKRCVDSGQLVKFDDATVDLLGVGSGAQLPAQAVMARLLAEELCDQVYSCAEE